MKPEQPATGNNARIAKNTAMLYVRMLFLTVISLYTVRITLEVLGAMDYGIYNVVASVIMSLNFLMATMSSATQRFLSYHLGRGDLESYNKAYSILIWGFVALSVIVVIVGEAIGPFLIHNVLVIPPEKVWAASVVYQFTMISFVASVMTVPFHAEIVANEKMGVYAYFSIADGLMRLGVVFLLMTVSIDKLILYGLLLGIQGWIMWAIYFIYCKVKFPFAKIRFVKDSQLAKSLGAYTGWNLFGSLSGMLIVQGQSVLLNVFFGPLVNTAKAIGDKVYSTVVNFSVNFFMAVSPQIVKSYAAGDVDRMLNLSLKGAKISFFLLTLISFPLLCEMPGILGLWLGKQEVSCTMVDFSRLLLIYSLIVSLEPPLTQMIRATGNMRKYQLEVGLWTLSYIPIAAMVIWLGGGPVSSMITLIVLYIWVMVVRVRITHQIVGLQYRQYIRGVVLPIFRVSLILAGSYVLISCIDLPDSLVLLAVNTGALLAWAFAIIWLAGLDRSDREFITGMIRKKIGKGH